MIDREEIHEALFMLLNDSSLGFETISRRLRHWRDVQTAEQPALFMTEVSETASVMTRVPTVWTINFNLYLYGNTGGDGRQAPMSILNPLIDSIVDVLKLTGGDVEQTLNGLVHRCRIAGTIETDEGALGDQAVAIIPISIIVPQ